MKLKGIEFGNILGASGVQGFFGEGYSHHRCLNFIPGFSFEGMTFVAKTTTLLPTTGNMPLQTNGIIPRDIFPKCIVVKPFKGVALNAVGLSGPGAEALLDDGRWQERTKPFFISFMSVQKTPEARIKEACMFFDLLAKHLPSFNAPLGLQINFSCPNVGIDTESILPEVQEVINKVQNLDIPIMPKFNALLPVSVAKDLDSNPGCDAICISNTIPWKDIPDDLKEYYFGSTTSPLAKFGGGGLSGKPLLELTSNWVESARALGVKMPINAGGGILHPNDVNRLKQTGADSIFLGSVTFLRPHKMKSIIQTAQRIFG